MSTSDPNRSALSDRVQSLRLSSRNGSTSPVGSRLRWLPWIFSLVLLLTTLAFGYRAYRIDRMQLLAEVESEDAKPSAAPSKSPANGTPNSTPTTTVASTGDVVLQSKGYVIPISLVQVSPKVGGQLVALAKVEGPDGSRIFIEGDKFKKGDILAWIEKVEFESDYQQALFALEGASQRLEEITRTLPEEIKQAEAELDETRSLATQQKLELERNRRLSAGNAVPTRELEQARYSYDSTMAKIKKLEATLRLIKEGRYERRVRAAEAEKQQSEWALEKAKWRRDNTEVKAPISGTILSKKAELGNIVNPSAFSSGISASLCEMADLTKLEIDLSIQERDIANVRVGQSCLILPEAYKDDKEFLARHPRGYRGVVSRLMPTADRAKGAVPVRVRILEGEISEDEAGNYLRPELSTTVSFLRAADPAPAGGQLRTAITKPK